MFRAVCWEIKGPARTRDLCVTKLTDTAEWTGCWTPAGLRGIFYLPKWESLLEGISYYSSSVLTAKHQPEKADTIHNNQDICACWHQVLAGTLLRTTFHTRGVTFMSWLWNTRMDFTSTHKHTCPHMEMMMGSIHQQLDTKHVLALFKTKTLQVKREISSGSWVLP